MTLGMIDIGFAKFFTLDHLWIFLQVLAVFMVGLLLSRGVAAVVVKIAKRRSSKQNTMVLGRLVSFALLGIVLMTCLNILGIKLSVLLGAAGILTVAVGFASQTTGEVLSIDLLSVKLRTFDNLLVRVPNEEIIKTQVTNLTHFPIRRFDMQLGVAYKEDLDRVRDILMDVAEANNLCLIDPGPLFIIKGFGSSSVDIQFSVWAQREKWLEMRNAMHVQVKRAFDEAGIEIPFPHVSVYTGSVTTPFPVKVTGGDHPAAQ